METHEKRVLGSGLVVRGFTSVSLLLLVKLISLRGLSNGNVTQFSLESSAPLKLYQSSSHPFKPAC